MPVSSYSDALSWLFTHSNVEEWAFASEPVLPLEARLVSDMFWVNHETLIRDLRAIWNDAFASPPPPVRHGRNVGWR